MSSSGKDCHTDFQRLSFNGKTSVVLCKPRTGRMHQIRVHLQYLGKPINFQFHEIFRENKLRRFHEIYSVKESEG